MDRGVLTLAATGPAKLTGALRARRSAERLVRARGMASRTSGTEVLASSFGSNTSSASAGTAGHRFQGAPHSEQAAAAEDAVEGDALAGASADRAVRLSAEELESACVSIPWLLRVSWGCSPRPLLGSLPGRQKGEAAKYADVLFFVARRRRRRPSRARAARARWA